MNESIIKFGLVLPLSLFVLMLAACGSSVTSTSSTLDRVDGNTKFVVYDNPNLRYSLEYPSDWTKEAINQNEMGFKPKGSEFAQVQVAAYQENLPISTVNPTSMAAAIEAGLRQFFEGITRQGDSTCNGLDVYLNEPSSQRWDWTTAYTVFCDDVPLQGVQRIMAETNYTYTLTMMYPSGTTFDDGWDVVNSFRFK